MDPNGSRVRTLPDGSGTWPSGDEPRPPSPSANASPSPSGERPRARSGSIPRIPLDPTSAPSVSRLPSTRLSAISQTVPIPRPVLASQCLLDDVAPLEARARGTRLATGAIAIGLLAVAVAFALVVRFERAVAGAAGYVVAGAIAAAASTIGSYAVRARLVAAAAIVALGSLFGFVAAFGDALNAIAHTLPAIALSAVLLVRSSYRGHRGTRIALGPALLAFGASGLLVDGSAGPFGVAVVGAIVTFSTTSLLGFMSEQTSGGCAVWSPLVVATVGVAVARPFMPAGAVAIVVAVACALSVALATIAAFQFVALRVAPRERARLEKAVRAPLR
jgi:hypothetical protein